MKRFVAFFISILLILSSFSGVALADEELTVEPVIEAETETTEQIVTDEDDTADNDELLMEFIEISVYDSNAPMYSVAGLRNLTGINVKVYGLVKAAAAKVAKGEESSTIFTFNMSDLGLDGTYSAADLGVEAIVSNGAVTDEAQDVLLAKLQAIELGRVNTALQYDYPAEFYWYEKTVGCKMSYSYGFDASYDNSLGEYVLGFSNKTYVTLSYTVAEDYAVGKAKGTYVVDGDVIAPIQTAIDHAGDIITTHAGESDYQKLISYKDEICDAVAYNTPAGQGGYQYKYGNPWQLIWVFDEDPTTNVVCEGYSKAFQFLCDGSTFSSPVIESRIVTGNMDGGTGAGGHMWNVVTMDDGLNYLVDVTNCDSGNVGNPDKLFLVGDANGSVGSGYSIAIPGQSTITFAYDEGTQSIYTDAELALAASNYTPQQGGDTYPSMQGGSEVYPSMDNFAQVFPSAQNGVDLSGAVFAVTAVTKTINDSLASSVSEVPLENLHFIQEWDVTSDTYPLNVTFYVAGTNNMTLYVISDSDNGWTRVSKGQGSSLMVTFTEDTHAAVYVGPSLLSSIEVDPITLYEGTYCNVNWNQERTDAYVEYNLWSIANVTVTYDGKEYSGTPAYLQSRLPYETQSQITINITSDQSEGTPWVAGHTYEAKATINNRLETTFDVTIAESPFVSMEVEDMTLIENVDGWTFDEYDDNWNLVSYFRYSVAPEVTMETKDGKTYVIGKNQALPYQDTFFSVYSLDDQTLNHWEAGTHQALIYCGGLKKTINVTVGESPVSSIDTAPFRAYEGVTTSFNRFRPFTVTLKDGTTLEGDRGLLQYKGISYDRTIDPGTSSEEWTAGNTYSVRATALGYSRDIPVVVYGIDSIEMQENNGLTIIIHQTDGETVTANVKYFEKFGSYAASETEGYLVTDQGAFYATVVNYDTAQNVKIILGGFESNALASSKWWETNRRAMSIWRMGGTFKGIVTKDNINNLIMDTLFFSPYNLSAVMPNVYEAALVKEAMQQVFLITEDFDMSLSDMYNADNDTIQISNWGIGGKTPEFLIIATDTELGFTRLAATGPQYDTYFLFDDNYKVKSMVREGDTPVPHEHTWGEWEVVTEATTTTEGLKKRVCSECGEEETEVIPKVSRIQSLSVQNVSVIEETCGIMRTQGDPNTGEAVSYFDYNVGECLNLYIDITIDGERYTGTYYDLSLEIPDLVFDATGPDAEHPWVVGGTYDVVLTAILLDDESSASCPIKVMIIENPLSELTFEDREIVENTNGKYRPVPGSDDETYYHYYPSSGASLSVKYDGKVYSGDLDTVNDEVWEVSNHQIAILYLMVSSCVQDADHRWTVGNPYPVTVNIGKLSSTFTVTIIPEAHVHTWGEWEVVTEPTCTAEGLKRRTCSGCEDVEEETIAALGHTWDTDYTIDKPATCTEEGSKSIHCSVCGEVKEGSAVAIEKLPHSYGEWVVTKEATCTEAGLKEKVCTACGDKVTEAIPAGHKWNDFYTVDKEATHFKEGLESIHCARCDEIKEGSELVIPVMMPTPNSWFKEDGVWYYANSVGELAKGWLKVGSTWYYMDPTTGAMQTGLITVGNAKYYLDPSSGAMKTGWINDDGTWYYAQGSGALATGWVQSGSTWYYMDPTTCAMKTGWVKDNGSWYYMKESGAMATGWVKSGNDWYYMSASGVMTTGWVKVGDSWYYMKASGAMAANEWCSGYWLNANGTWTYQPRGSWKQDSTGWWFGDTSGWYAKNTTIKIDGKEYTFDAKGYLVEE